MTEHVIGNFQHCEFGYILVYLFVRNNAKLYVRPELQVFWCWSAISKMPASHAGRRPSWGLPIKHIVLPRLLSTVYIIIIIIQVSSQALHSTVQWFSRRVTTCYNLWKLKAASSTTCRAQLPSAISAPLASRGAGCNQSAPRAQGQINADSCWAQPDEP